MTLGEELEIKRPAFIYHVSKDFQFLIDEFGYTKPKYRFLKQDNGLFILDEFKYENNAIDRVITISNAYSHIDYGFEISFNRPSVSLTRSQGKMVIYVLKEKQDIEQTYLENIAQKFREEYKDVLSGVKWL